MPAEKNLVLSQKDLQALMAMGDAGWGLPKTTPKKKKRSFWSKLSNIGSQALKPLSIPQAALFTGAAKIGAGLGLNNDVSWKNLGGDYYGNYTGAKMVGVDNKWAKLGTELIVDPLWFVGGVNVAAKAGKLGKTAVEAGSTARSVARVADDALLKDKEVRQLLHLQDKTRKAEKVSDPKGWTAAERAAHESGDWRKFSEARGYTKSEMRDYSKYLKLHEKITKKYGKDVAEDLFYSPESFATGLRGLKLDKMGVIEEPTRHLAETAARHADAVGRGSVQAAVRLGTKKHGLNLRIPGTTRGPKSFTKSLKPGFLNPAPAEEVGMRIVRSGREQGDQLAFQVENVSKKFGLTQQERVAVQLVGRAGEGKAEEVAAVLKQQGHWRPEAQEALDYMVGLNQRLSIERGYDDLPGAIATAERRVDDLERQIAAQGGPMAPVALRAKMTDALGELNVLRASDQYLAQGPTARSLRDLGQEMRKAQRKGERVTDTTYAPGRSLGDDLMQSRVFEDPFKTVTPQQFVDDMIEKGFDPEDAMVLRDVLGVERFADEAQKFSNSEVFYRPEWDAFTVAGQSLKNFTTTYARDKLVLDFLKKVGVSSESAVGMAARRRPNITNQPGSLGHHVGEYVKPAIVALKTGYTTVNLSHFVNNALGDLVNSWVNGNIRHVGAIGGMVPRNKIWRLANGDEKMLAEKFMVNGVEMQGDQLLAQIHTAGIGHGMLQHDVLAMGENIEDARKIQAWLHDSTNPFNIVAKMSRLNARREGAQRLNTWLKHLRGGDDPITAAEKTLKVHFDYQHLTAFEQNWMRNMFLFYVWIKRNTLLHSGGLLTRPALYAAYADMERNRTTFENEPSWYSEQGAISLPFGLGNYQFANPINDLHKIKLNMEGLRQYLISPINPAGRMPLETLFNKNAYTGRPISDYPDQMKPHWLTELLQLGPMTRARQGGERGNSINPYLGYLIDQLVGPQASRGNILTDPDYEGNRGLDVIASMLGAKEQRDKPVQFIRNKEAEEAAKKRSETRAANARKEGP